MAVSKEIKNAIVDVLMWRIDRGNYGMLSTYRMNSRSTMVLANNGIKITNKFCTTDEVTQDGKVVAKITYRYAAHKKDGMYKMLRPKIEYV